MPSLWCLVLAQLLHLAASAHDCESGDNLFPANATMLQLNFTDLKDMVYSGHHCWLLLVYSSFNGYSRAYATEFLQFVVSISRWSHTLRVAAINTAPLHNLPAVGHFQLAGLPALLFVPVGAGFGQQKETLVPRQPELLLDVLYPQLQRRVPNLKPFASLTRAIRRFPETGSATRLAFLEEREGDLSMHAVMDFHKSKRVLVAWRRSIKVKSGSVRLAVYSVASGRRRRLLRRRTVVNSLAELQGRIAKEELGPLGRRLLRQQQQWPTPQLPTVACDTSEESRWRRPTVDDLVEAVRQELSVACPQAWQPMAAFVRLLGNLLGRRYRRLRPLLSLEASLPRLPPRPAAWQRLLLLHGLAPALSRTRAGQPPAAVCSGNSSAAVECRQWVLVHWLTCARAAGGQRSAAVLPTTAEFLLKCRGRRLVSADGRPNCSAEEELLQAWRQHNSQRPRRFPPDAVCPGCKDSDVAEFLLHWYGMAAEADLWPAVGAKREEVAVEEWTGEAFEQAEPRDCGGQCPAAPEAADCYAAPLVLALMVALTPAVLLLLFRTRWRRRRQC